MGSFDNAAPTFEKHTPVLRLNRRKDPKARWVLWPVFTFRVVAPIPKERRLNLFQRAAMGLSRAGVVRAADVADRLRIAPDLAALIALELQRMGLVDHEWRPTRRGLEALEDVEEEPPEEARVGHVLSDPFTGKLWPRFLVGDLPLADVELNEEGFPVLLSGSAGDRWKDRTFCVFPQSQDAMIPTQPSARDVLRAARRHRRQRRVDELSDERDVPRMERVSFVDDRPHAYWLALCARRHETGDWMVDDPFGHGEAVDLRARLEARLDRQKGLRQWLDPLVGSAEHGSTPDVLQEEAGWKVEERLTLAIRAHEAARERLVAMERAHLEASMKGAPLDKWDDVLVKAQRAVERALHIVIDPYRGTEPPLSAALAASDKELNRMHLDAIAAELGFPSPLPRALSSIRRASVQEAEQRMSGSLRSLLVLALLCADRDEAHPLRRAPKVSPDLLCRLDALAAARNRAAHDAEAALPQRVPDHVNAAYDAIDILLIRR